MLKKTFTILIAVISVAVFVSDASAIGSSKRRRIRIKIIGTCDSAVNNNKTGPEQTSDIADGTECTARISVWKRVKNADRGSRRRPMRGRAVTLQDRNVPQKVYSDLSSSTTDRRGRTTIRFNWADESCEYRAVFGEDTSKEMSDTVRTLIYSDIGTCDTLF